MRTGRLRRSDRGNPFPMHLGRRAAAVFACAVAAAALAPAGVAAAPPAPFGHAYEPRSGVLFCPTRMLADRVPSFDGTPLDVDVTLPADAEAGRPLPTIVMLHGWGGDKSNFETDSPEDTSSTTYHYNNTYYAQRGYAVVNPTARGFGRSCGKAGFTAECETRRSYIHLADQRWEARDAQHLLGLLADQRVSDPAALGVTGISYGGGQSIELAYLRDRIRRRDGSFTAWRSPAGQPMAIRAAYPRWPWSDLVDSLMPNGRYLDFRAPEAADSRDPIGIMKESYVTGLFGLGEGSGVYCGTPPHTVPCTDPTADLPRWYLRIQAGEPYGPDARQIADEIHEFHQGYGIEGRTPARRMGGASARRPRPRARVQQGERGPALQRRRLGLLRPLAARRLGWPGVRPGHGVHPDLPAPGAGRRPVRGLELRRPRARVRAVRQRPDAARRIGGRQPAHGHGLRPDRRRR